MILSELEHNKHKIVGKLLHPAEITNIINDSIGDIYDIVVSSENSPKLDNNDLAINGLFDPDRWDEEKNVELFIVYSSKIKSGMIIDNDGWNRLSFEIYKAIEHENIHRMQERNRFGLNPFNDKRRNISDWYFHDPDEIDAHANDIALELLFYNYSVNDAKNRLLSFKSIKPEESITLFSYLIHFKYDINHDCMKKLIKKAIKWLDEKEEL